MRHLFVPTWIFIAFCFSPLSMAETTLSQVEYDLLKVRLSNQLKKEKFEDAISSIGQIKASGYEYSPTLLYFEGFALQQSGQLSTAKSAYLNYLETAGSEGKYYQKSLQNIVAIETDLDAALQQYKTLLNQEPSDSNLAQIKQLEQKLGDSVQPLRAEFDKQQLAAAQEAQAKEKAEQERLAAEEIARKKQTWEVVLDNNAQLADITVSNNNDIVAVGSIKTATCSNINSWWLVTLDMDGKQKVNKNSCAISGKSKLPTFFTGVEADPRGGFYTVGVADEDKRKLQVGAVYHFKDNADLDWRSYSIKPTEKLLSNSQHGIFYDSHLTRSGNIVVAGASHSSGRGEVTLFDANGQKIWTEQAYNVLFSRRDFNAVTEHENGNILYAGYSTKFGKNNGYIQEKDANGKSAYYDGKEKTMETWWNVLHDVIPTEDGGLIVVGDSEQSVDDQTRQAPTAQAIIRRVNADYETVWKIHYRSEAGASSARKIIRDGADYIIAGMTTVNGSEQGRIYKINGNGDLIWSETHGDEDNDIFTSITASPNNDGFIVSGQKNGAGWVMKLNTQGQLN